MENVDTRGEVGATTVYELSYLLLPALAAEEISAKGSSLKNLISKTGGELISFEEPILIDLAYPMVKVIQTIRHKAGSGYFGWIKFEMEKSNIAKIKKALDNDFNVLRYLIIKTVRENTLLLGKMKMQKEGRVRKEESEEIPDEIPKGVIAEDIDKSIDDLVIV